MGRLLLCGIVLLQVTPAVTPQTPIQRFEARYRSARTLRVEFLERYSENGKLVRAEAGTAYFRKPGKMRWEYEKPEKNLFLVDGKTAWLYTPADHTATKVPARQSEDWRTPFVLLAGEMKLVESLRKSRKHIDADSGKSGRRHAGMQTERGRHARVPGIRKMRRRKCSSKFRVKASLYGCWCVPAGGIETEFQFKNWEINPPVPDSLFRFSPPPGVVIVDGLLPSSPGVRQ